jgi:hypothetical protein
MLTVIMLRVVILTVDFLLPDQQPHHLHHRGNLPTGLQRRHDSALFDGSLWNCQQQPDTGKKTDFFPLYWCYLWNENNSKRNSFIQWYSLKVRTAFYIKQKRRGREQDSCVTEVECVRDSAWSKGRSSISHKIYRWRNTFGEINVGFICEINKIPENVNDLGPTVSICFIWTNTRDILHDDRSHISHSI